MPGQQERSRSPMRCPLDDSQIRDEFEYQLTQPALAAELAGGSGHIEPFTAPSMSIRQPSIQQHIQNNQNDQHNINNLRI